MWEMSTICIELINQERTQHHCAKTSALYTKGQKEKRTPNALATMFCPGHNRVFSFVWVALKKESSPYRLQQRIWLEVLYLFLIRVFSFVWVALKKESSPYRLQLILGKVLTFIINLYFFTATHTKEKTLMSCRRRLGQDILVKMSWPGHYALGQDIRILIRFSVREL